jgi:hypothetical protein
VCNPRKLPPITPTIISARATERPTRIEIRLAARAKAIQIVAMSQMLSMISSNGVEDKKSPYYLL